MKILEQIDNYVLHSAEVKKLESEVELYKRSEFYASVEGDLSYGNGDYKSEKQYNESYKFSRQKREEANTKLATEKRLLNASIEDLSNSMSNISKKDLQVAKDKTSLKIEQLSEYVAGLQEKMKIAKEKGDLAFSQGNYRDEKIYNAEYKSAYEETQKIGPVIGEYKNVLSFLNFREQTINESSASEPSFS